MKKHLVIIFSVLGGFSIVEGLSNYVSKSEIIGRYTNNNTESLLEGPRSISQGVDTLIMKGDNTFESQTWGTGTYNIEPSVFGTLIILTSESGTGKRIFSAKVTAPWFRPGKIWLDYDQNFFYEEI